MERNQFTNSRSIQKKISLELYHVESGHGIDQAKLAVKSEMKNILSIWLEIAIIDWLIIV